MTSWYNEPDAFKAAVLREAIKAGAIAAGVVDERSIKDVRAADLVGFTQCHFFAGGGLWSLALRNAGWPDDRPVWTGSCPCPSFSAAGKGGGFDDPRHLWPDWEKLIRERRPATIFGEQADDSIGYGWLDLVQTDLEAQAYSVGKIVFGTASVGGADIRQRLYFVAESGSERGGPGLCDCWQGGQRGHQHSDRGGALVVACHCECWRCRKREGNHCIRCDVAGPGSGRGIPQPGVLAANASGLLGDATLRGRGISRDEAQQGRGGYADSADQPRGVGHSERERLQERECGRRVPDQATARDARAQPERGSDPGGMEHTDLPGSARLGADGGKDTGARGLRPGSADSGGAGGLADADGGQPRDGELQRSREHGLEPEDGGALRLEDSEPGRLDPRSTPGAGFQSGDALAEHGGNSGSVADAASIRSECFESGESSGVQREASGSRGPQYQLSDHSASAGGMAQPLHPERRPLDVNGSDGCDGENEGRQETHGIFGARGEVRQRSSPLNGPWRDADWLLCRDGKWRPVESGTFPLAHGDPCRLGRLRLYGDAINVEVATAFIRAYLEATEGE